MKQIIIGSAILLCIFAAMISWQVWKKRNASAAMMTLCLRLGATGLLVYLAWIALLNYDESQSIDDGSDRPRQLIVLQDKSTSMTFPDGDRTRGAIADTIWKHVRKTADNRAYVDVSRIVFASNSVEDDRPHLLRPGATNTGKALTNVLSRYGADAILVISDGATTTGQPPSYMLKWAENRGIGLYAIGVGATDGELCDINVADAQCQQTNPDTVQVELSGLGSVPDFTMVRLSINGKQVASRRVTIKGKTSLTFSVPRVEDGWHEFEIEAISPENEICQINNRRMGVFRQQAAQKILFLYSSPQMEYRHMTRFLEDLYPDRIEALSVFSDDFKNLDLEDYIFCIMGNVKRSRISNELLQAIDSGRIPTLFLSGTHLADWSGVQEPFPLARTTRHWNVFAETGRGGRITRSTGLTDNRWRMGEFEMLPVYDLLEAVPNDKAVTLLECVAGTNRYPLLVVDAADKPRTFVMLTNSSWRWSLSPDSNIRSAFRAIWRRITDMAITIERSNKPLLVSAELDETDLSSITIHVDHETPAYTSELKEVTVMRRQGDINTSIEPKLEGDSWVASIEPPEQRPAVIWLNGSAKLQGRKIDSQPFPIVFNPDGLEFSDTLPHPEKLKALIADPKSNFADALSAQPLIERIFESLKRPPVKQQVRQRDWSKELTIALIILLLFCIEWFLERRYKEQSA